MNIRRGLQLWSTRQTRGSNMKLISIGFGNAGNADRIVAVVSPEAAPVKRIVQLAKDSGTAIDATCGRRTRSVIICDSGHVVMSAFPSPASSDRPQENNSRAGLSDPPILSV